MIREWAYNEETNTAFLSLCSAFEKLNCRIVSLKIRGPVDWETIDVGQWYGVEIVEEVPKR